MQIWPHHMVCCPRVEDPSSVLLLLVPSADLSEHSLLLLLNQLSSRYLYHPQLLLLLGIYRPLIDNAHQSNYIIDYFHGFGIGIGDVE